MDDIKEKIKQALRHIWINKYRLFFCLLTLCCLFGLVHYFKSADSATASISFNYSEAALGMNPNKTRFNAYEIVSDEVMERAIRRVGLQDSLTASQLAVSISARKAPAAPMAASISAPTTIFPSIPANWSLAAASPWIFCRACANPTGRSFRAATATTRAC